MSKRLKVLMAGPSPYANGGVASVARNYLEQGLADRCDLRYITTMKEGNKFYKLFLALASYAEFSRVVQNYDLVHLHVSKGASITRKRLLAKCAQRKGIPYIIHLHSGQFDQVFEAADESEKGILRDFFNEAAAVIALSEEWKEYLVPRLCPPEQVAVLHNAVQVPKKASFSYSRTVLFLGRLGVRKNPEVLLRAGKKLIEQFSDLKLIFAGDGDIAAYQNLANDLGIEKYCEFLGWVSDIEILFKRSCIFCLPSKAEGMPMALLEAMAHGLVPVVSPVGGIPSLVEDGINGYLVPVGDSEVLAETLMGLFSNPSLCARVGAFARRTIQDHFSMDAHLDKLELLYRKVAIRSHFITNKREDASC